MKKILLIGSVTTDVTMRVDRLPAKEEDVNVQEQVMRVGGCAFNASSAVRLLDVPFTLAYDLGTGVYGDHIAREMAAREIPVFWRNKKENGSCYCLVEPDGDRTFLAVHGAEYEFPDEMFTGLDPQDYDLCYISGIDLEDEAGGGIVRCARRMQQGGAQVVFAAGPRIMHITEDRLRAVMDVHPILHLNRREGQMLAHRLGIMFQSDHDVAVALHDVTKAPVIMTGGPLDVLWCGGDGQVHRVPAVVSDNVVDGTGAGDCHIGTIMAALMKGFGMDEAIGMANRVSAAVVGLYGGEIRKEDF